MAKPKKNITHQFNCKFDDVMFWKIKVAAASESKNPTEWIESLVKDFLKFRK